MKFPGTLLLLIAIFIANNAIADNKESLQPAPLCSDTSQGGTPEDLRLDQERISMQSALKSLSYIEEEIVIVMGSYDPRKQRNCLHPDCIGGVPWETVNMGVPNRLLNIRGALLRLNTLYLRERYQTLRDKSSQTAFEAAKKEYCYFMSHQAVVD